MDIHHLRYFVAVAQTPNITKAAEQLFISRQALSKAIRELELECGNELFTRINGKLKITPFGLDFFDQSKQIVDLFNRLEQTTSAKSTGKPEKINLAIGLGSLHMLSPEIFAGFKNKFPDVSLSMHEAFDDEVRLFIQNEQADIGILGTTPARLQAFDFYLIQSGTIWFQVSRQHPLALKEVLSPQDLDRQPFVTLGNRCDMHCVLMDLCQKADSFPNIILETADSNVANELVSANKAISLGMPTKKLPADSPMRILPMDLGDVPWGVYLISKKGQRPSKASNLLIQYLSGRVQ
jgi:DNA-binding transcriptional LysR family regulator